MFEMNILMKSDKHRVRSKLQELYKETCTIYVRKNVGNFLSTSHLTRKKFVENFDEVFCALHEKVGVDPESIEVIERKVDEKLAALGRYRKVEGFMGGEEMAKTLYNALLGKEAKDLLHFICTPIDLYGPEPCAECGNSNTPQEVDSSSEVSEEKFKEKDEAS